MSESDPLVAQILSSYLSRNTVAATDLPSVIESAKRAFGGITGAISTVPSGGASKTWQPAVSVKKSVTPEAIVCLCCGRRFKSLKRHLQRTHKLTPSEYLFAFGLKSDYPLVAPNYAAQRSTLAKQLGFGRKVGKKPAPRKRAAKRPAKATEAAAAE